MKTRTLLGPLALSFACFPFACGGDPGEKEGSSAPGAVPLDEGDTDIVIDAQGGAEGAGVAGPRDGGIVELTAEEATNLSTAACTGWSAEGESIPAVLEFVVDVSGSMDREAPGADDSSKWEVTHEALTEAIDSLPASIAVGMLFYPNVENGNESDEPQDLDQCIAVDQLIDMAPLGAPGSPHRQNIQTGLDDANPNFLTPTHDAYKYALENGLKPYQTNARKFMLLITDGAPTMSEGCVGTTNPLRDMPTDVIIADIAAAQAEGISTFLIGSPGSEESQTGNDMRPWLSEAAQVGGTAAADCSVDGPNFCHMDMTQEPDFAAALKAGLAQIAGQIIDSCTFVVPEPPEGEAINPDKTNVVVRRGDGSVILVLPDEIGDCAEGWQFNAEGNVVLCADSCNNVKLDPSASVQLTFGCGLDEVVPVR